MAKKKSVRKVKPPTATTDPDAAKVDLRSYIPKYREKVEDQLEDPLADKAEGVLIASILSTYGIPGYATLLHDFIESVEQVAEIISTYVQRTSIRRPLNFMIIAPPGSGKSQLAKSIEMLVSKDILQFVSFNMAAIQSTEDFAHAMNAARNVVVEGRIPLVLVDEFDADEKNYAALLPVLWDGEIVVDGRLLRLERTVYLLAGSKSTLTDSLQKAQDMSENHAQNDDATKLVDLFSRINGTVIQIPKLEGCDRAILAMAMLRKRFPKCVRVPWNLLQFLADCDLRYEARSIGTIVDLLALRIKSPLDCEAITQDDLQQLPFRSPQTLSKSSLAFHLIHKKSATGVISLWNKCLKHNFEQEIRRNGLPERTGTETLNQMADWSALIVYLGDA